MLWFSISIKVGAGARHDVESKGIVGHVVVIDVDVDVRVGCPLAPLRSMSLTTMSFVEVVQEPDGCSPYPE